MAARPATRQHERIRLNGDDPSFAAGPRERLSTLMSDPRERREIWGDDAYERDASDVVDELLAEPGGAQAWHDDPSITWIKAVGRFIMRNGKRVGVSIAGFAVLLAGIVLLVLPGPGLVLIVAGLAILSTEYVWARRLLAIAKRKAEQAKEVVLRKGESADPAATDGISPSTDDAV